jgi:hypothetical protein
MRYYSSTATPKTLSGAISSSATSIVLSDTVGLPGSSYPFTLVIEPDTDNEEIVLVTAATGGVANGYEIVRGTNTSGGIQGGDGSTARSHDNGVAVRHMVTARDLQEPQTHMNASTGVHGATGAVVGTTDSQVLTNKTISSASNTLAIAQSAVTNLTYDLGLKANSAGPTFTGTVVLPSTTSIGSVSNTEISYLDGVTSAIQTQFTGKAASTHTHVKGDITTGTIPTKLSAGVKTVAVSASNLGTAPQALTGFTATPVVTATSDNGQYNVAISSVSSSSVSFTVRHIDNSTATVNVDVHWIAVQV